MIQSLQKAGITQLICVAVVGSALAQSAEIQPGTTVVVTQDGAELMLGTRAVANVPKGTEFSVTEVRGVWVGGRAHLDGKSVEGWLRRSHLAISSDLPGESAEEFDWHKPGLSGASSPKKVGVLYVIYDQFSGEGINKEYLDPKLDADTAKESPNDWLTYKPRLTTGELIRRFGNRLVAETKHLLKENRVDCDVRALQAAKSLDSALEDFSSCDVCVVACLGEVGAGITSLLGGSTFASTQMNLDFVLVDSGKKPLAGYSRMSIQELPTVGQLEKSYQSANEIQKDYKYRFTDDAFWSAASPAVLNTLKDPFLSFLKSQTGSVPGKSGRGDNATSKTTPKV
jgi:hypothetical protein